MAAGQQGKAPCGAAWYGVRPGNPDCGCGWGQLCTAPQNADNCHHVNGGEVRADGWTCDDCGAFFTNGTVVEGEGDTVTTRDAGDTVTRPRLHALAVQAQTRADLTGIPHYVLETAVDRWVCGHGAYNALWPTLVPVFTAVPHEVTQ